MKKHSFFHFSLTLLLGLVFCLPLNSLAQESKTPPKAPKRAHHKVWSDFLKKCVNQDGSVSYRLAKVNKEMLQEYLNHLAENPPTEEWSKEEVIAYWMNGYNAATVKLIVDNYPVQSIKDIDSPWDQKVFKSGSKTYTLNQVENDILRPMSPLVHFGLNCASKSCPKLLNVPYISSVLWRQLNAQTAEFMADKNQNQVSPNSLKLSRLFEWYEADFYLEGESTVHAFVGRYAKMQVNADAPIQYMEYDWGLNDGPPPGQNSRN